MNTLTSLSSEALTSRIDQLIGNERRCIVDFVHHLAELERRKLHKDLGYASTFAYCTERLKLSKACAHRRTTAASLIVRFPVIADYLSDGRICLSKLAILSKVLTEENHADVLARAANCTEQQVELLAVTLTPRPERTESLRASPTRSVQPIQSVAVEPTPGLESSSEAEPTAVVATPLVRPTKPATLKFATPERLNLSMSVSREFADDLKQVTAALSHVVPTGRMEDVLHECIRIALGACERRRGGLPQTAQVGSEAEPQAAEPRAEASLDETAVGDDTADVGSEAEPDGRYIPAPVRRAVWKRDGGRCVFVGTSGHRCNSTYQLELNHRIPWALGGPSTLENLDLRCRAHNQRAAEFDFGESFMAQFKRTD